jgi:hypothetical protein
MRRGCGIVAHPTRTCGRRKRQSHRPAGAGGLGRPGWQEPLNLLGRGGVGWGGVGWGVGAGVVRGWGRVRVVDACTGKSRRTGCPVRAIAQDRRGPLHNRLAALSLQKCGVLEAWGAKCTGQAG